MSHTDIRRAERPDPDQVLVDIADYVCDYEITSDAAWETARYCLMDTLACAFQALDYPACTKLLGPVVPGATMAGGTRVPGTSWELDPVQGAFNIGIGGEYLYFGRRMRSGINVGPSILLFDTGIDPAGTTGLFLDVRPAGLRWRLHDNVLIQFDPLTFTVVAPALSGIPLVVIEYRTALAFEFSLITPRD